MNWAFNLGRIFGIRIRIHYFFLLFIGFLVLRQGMADKANKTAAAPGLLILLVLLFGFVLLHELGHSLMAKRFGVEVKDITLWPLGGIARLGRIPEDPKTELAIAAAGPLVNVAIVLVLAPVAILTGSDPGTDLIIFPPTTFLSFCIVANLFMAAFNCIPAFPMDGGRVLRAILGYRMGFVEATRKAVRVGRFFAILFVLGGLLLAMDRLTSGEGMPPGPVMLSLIGFFVLFVGAQEERSVRFRSVLEKLASDGDVIEPGSQDAILQDALNQGDLEQVRRLLEDRIAETKESGDPQPPGE